MVGGKIVDYYATQNMVRFLVKGTGSEKNDYTTVRAAVPKSAMSKIKEGDPIWWQNPNVYLQVFGEQDVPFIKIGNSHGTAKGFFKSKQKYLSVKEGIQCCSCGWFGTEAGCDKENDTEWIGQKCFCPECGKDEFFKCHVVAETD